MDYKNGVEACLLKKDSEENMNTSHRKSLRDIPLEVRRKDAKKPLFLFRYE